MLAVKIFQGDPDELNSEVIGYVENNQSVCGLEVALYQGSALPKDHLDRIAALPRKIKILHTYHRQIGLMELERNDPVAHNKLRTEAEFAESMGIDKAVVHSTTLGEHSVVHPDAHSIAAGWAKSVEYMNALGLRPHLENTTESIFWLQDLFDTWDQLGIQELAGFTLDIGHVRVWSDRTLNDWLIFTKQLAARGFGIHFHIHANHGEVDEHISLQHAFQKDLLEPSLEWAPEGLIAWIVEAMKDHPQSLFTLENPAHQALANLSFTRFMLNQEPHTNLMAL